MFTGIIQSLGTTQHLGGDRLRITWGKSMPLDAIQDLTLGDSVSVDGICLTVSEILPHGFVADASPETISRTTLGLTQGSASVNLETSLRVGSKIGGHFVTGHIDGIGYVQSIVQTENAWEMSFRVSDARVSRYIVPKGSIAINGVSLTVADCNSAGSWFKVAVIPVTYAETNLSQLKPNDCVNLEGDVLGKYVEKFLRLNPGDSSLDDRAEGVSVWDSTDVISPSFLAEHGYL